MTLNMDKDISEQILTLCREGCLLCAYVHFKQKRFNHKHPQFMFYPHGAVENQLALYEFLRTANMGPAMHSFQHTSRCERHWTPDRNAMKGVENALAIPPTMESLFRIANGAAPLCTTLRGYFDCEWDDNTCVWCGFTVERIEESEEE